MTSTAGARAYDFIREQIIEGRFAPGVRLKEEELTGLCGVSRTPVREALKQLAAEGLVVVEPHHGAQVASLSPEDLEETYQLRAMIEGYAAARAATRISPDALARLKSVQGALEAAIAAGGDRMVARFSQLNAEFHQIILEAAMSPRLLAMGQVVIEMPLRLRTVARYSQAEIDRSMHHHRELIAAFDARDADWARAVMSSHVRAALQVLIRDQRAKAAEG